MATRPAKLVVSAPGKLMLSGEYAVLEGAEAVVAAVDRRVRVWLAPAAARSTSLSPEVAAARREAERRWGVVSGELHVDVSATRHGTQKLGVGSSAASAAATAAMVRVANGGELHSQKAQQEVMDVALAAHQSVAPRGSGADVAAATFGGYLRFRRSARGVSFDPLAWPGTLQLKVVWTGTPARTSDMLDRVDEFRRRCPGDYAAALGDLRAAADGFAAALHCGVPSKTIQAIHEQYLAMKVLGTLCGSPIVNDSLKRVADLAQRAGGAAKPSGAGGGDVALALFDASSKAVEFERLCAASSLRVLDMALGSPGIRIEGGAP